jgi:hypothetical protein
VSIVFSGLVVHLTDYVGMGEPLMAAESLYNGRSDLRALRGGTTGESRQVFNKVTSTDFSVLQDQTGASEHQSPTGDDPLPEGEAPALFDGMTEMEIEDDPFRLDETRTETATATVTSLPPLRPPRSRPTTKMLSRGTEGTEMPVTSKQTKSI